MPCNVRYISSWCPGRHSRYLYIYIYICILSFSFLVNLNIVSGDTEQVKDEKIVHVRTEVNEETKASILKK